MEFMAPLIRHLLHAEPYYAHFLLNSRVAYDKWGIETAASGIVSGTPTIVLNSEYVRGLTVPQQAGLLKHEILHLLFHHGDRGAARDKKLFDIATDCAINQHISELPPNGVDLETLQQMSKNQFEEFQSTEYYYYGLQEECKQNKKLAQAIANMQTIDEHGFDIPGQEKNAKIAEAAAKSASQKAFSAAAGRISSELAKLLSGLTKDEKVPWATVLANFVANATSSKTQATRKRTNRRFGFDVPGKKKKRELVLGVAADSSGSVSDDQFESFMSELKHIVKHTSKTHFVDADCEVKKVYTLTSESDIKQERTGNGGTAYQPAITKLTEMGCDAIVYFGDMDISDKPEDPGIPVLWVTVGSEKRPGEFGHMIKMEV